MIFKNDLELGIVCSLILKRLKYLLKGPVEINSLIGDKKSVQTELQFPKKSIQRNSQGDIMGDLKDIKKKLLSKGKGIFNKSDTTTSRFPLLDDLNCSSVGQ